MTQKLYNNATVVYGSQTGNAADVASWISMRFVGVVENTRCCEGNALAGLDEFSSDGLYIFIVATAGNGDFPSNFKRLWHRLSCASSDEFPSFRFAVFGLGDSKYPQFNYAARRTYGRLTALGADPICQLGCGDDQNTLGYSQELVPWVSLLWRNAFNSDFRSVSNEQFSSYHIGQSCSSVSSSSQPSSQGCAQLLMNVRETNADHFQDVRRMKFRLVQRWEYQPGDVLCVVPKISVSVATTFITDVLKDNPDRVIRIENKGNGSIPSGDYSLLRIFSQVLDITALPPLVFYETLRDVFSAQMSVNGSLPSDEEKLVTDKLELLASFSPEGANERIRYSGKERLGIWEVLRDFSQIRMPAERLIDVVPIISPRYYSVANKCDSVTFPVYPGSSARLPVVTVELCVGLVEYTTLFGRSREGLTSGYLKNVPVGAWLDRVWLERGFSSDLAPKLENASNLLLIGPGTGLAPLRAITQHFCTRKRTLILTSFRNLKTDFLFRSDIESAFRSERVECVVAWSRPDRMDRSLPFSWNSFSFSPRQDGTGCTAGRKTWVQDLIQVKQVLVGEMLATDDTVIVIAGRSHPMPYQVLDALKEIAGESRVDALVKAGRIVFDTWG